MSKLRVGILFGGRSGEHEVSLLSAVSRVLQRKGFTVIQASNGSSALDTIRAYEDGIDAMLLDVTLPGASSREVFEEAKRLRPSMVVILTSAYSREHATAGFDGCTVEYFIRKPFGYGRRVSHAETTEC